MPPVCPVCLRLVLDTEEGLGCDGDCKRWFHRECVRISKTEYNRLSGDTNVKWYCTRTDCTSSPAIPITQLGNQMSSVLSKLDELIGKVSKIDGISEDVAEIRTEVSAIKSGLQLLEPRVAIIEDRVESVSLAVADIDSGLKTQEARLTKLESNHPSAESHVNLAIEEFNERTFRARNVMVFGLSESGRGTVQDKILDDRDRFQAIATAIDPTIDATGFKFFRVGKASGNKPRPIKVVVGCESTVRKIVKMATRDFLSGLDNRFSNVSVGRDRTRNEVMHLKRLRTELARRSESGEDNLTIKYIKGIPKIVQSKTIISNGTTSLNLLYQNANGIRSKLSYLHVSVPICLHDVIIFTETNLNSSISSSEMGFDDYVVYRKDRSALTSNKRDGGGVLLAVRKTLYSAEVLQPDLPVEALFVLVKFNPSMKVLICAVYIPPQSQTGLYSLFAESLTEVISTCHNYDTVLIAGDFNLPSLNWIAPDPFVAAPSARIMLDLASQLDISQLSNVLNDRRVQLDLIFGSPEIFSVSLESDPLLACEPCHPGLCVTGLAHYPSSPRIEPATYIRNINCCDLDGVKKDLENGLIQLDYGCEDTDILFSSFCKQLGDCIKSNSPWKRVGKSAFPKWFSAELKALVILKKTLHKKFKQSQDERDYFSFSRIRERCKAISRECRDSYVNYVNSTISSNTRVFWSFVNDLNRTLSMPSSLRFGEIEVCQPEDMCELFSTYFSSVYSPALQGTPPAQPFNTPFIFSNCSLSVDVIEKKLIALDPNKGHGPDEITPGVLKYCHSELVPQIHFLFNLSLSNGIFPAVLRDGFVVPIFKTGDRCDASNYRPIVIQSVLGKVFESLILDIMRPLFKQILDDEQHGFLVGRSTDTNLLSLQSFVMDALSRRNQVDAIYIDFSKAFDKISHRHLLAKLESHGVVGSMIRWFRSYLSDRRLFVRLGSQVSSPFIASSGVPQGSHLGPLLFSIFVNDIKEVITVPFLLFADDIKIFVEVISCQDSQLLQRNLDNILEWCSCNEMSVNPTKTKLITYSRKPTILVADYFIEGTAVERCNIIKDLGVVIDSTFEFGSHISNICSRASRSSGLIFRTVKHGLSTEAAVLMFKTLVRPLLEYSSVVWCPFQLQHINQLQSVQRRFVRFLGCRAGFRYLDVPVDELSAALGLESLECRRRVADLSFLYRLINHQIDCPGLLERIRFHVPTGTRQQRLFEPSHAARNYLRHSSIPRLMRLGNQICSTVDFFSSSLRAIKCAASEP